MLLVGFMRTEKAKEIRKQMRREYFTMREIINSNKHLKKNLLFEIYNGGQDAVVAASKLTKLEVEEATRPLLDKIENDKPLVDFAETIACNTDSIEIGTFAKLIKDEGIDMGRNKLYQWLRDNKYLRNNNEPYQKYIENEYFEISEYSVRTPYGEKLVIKTLITGKGKIKITEKLKRNFIE